MNEYIYIYSSMYIIVCECIYIYIYIYIYIWDQNLFYHRRMNSHLPAELSDRIGGSVDLPSVEPPMKARRGRSLVLLSMEGASYVAIDYP